MSGGIPTWHPSALFGADDVGYVIDLRGFFVDYPVEPEGETVMCTVDTRGASQHIGLAVSTLEKLRVSGGGPRYVKLGRVVRYRVTDLEEYLAERVRENTSDAT